MKRVITAVVAGVLFLGACGGDKADAPEPSADAKTEFTSALDTLGAAPGQTLTVSLDSDVASLQALAADDGSELSEADAQKILGSSIRISAKNTTDPKDSAAAIVINLAGNDAIELRTIGYSFYARADIDRIAETFGQDPNAIRALGQQAATGPLSFVKDALEGKWLSIEGLDQFAKGLGQPVDGPTEEQKALYSKFLDTLKGSTEVGNEGDDSVGTHLVATFNLRQLYQGFVDLSAGLGTALPGGGGLPPVSDIPDENIHLDVWVRDGKIVQVVFDMLQIGQIADDEEIPEGVEKLGVKLTLEDFDGIVEVPEGAVKVDPTAIFGSLFGGIPGGVHPGGGGGKGAGGYGAEFPCEMLEGEPREVLEQFKDECPELLKK